MKLEMPADIRYLYIHGHLYAEESLQLGIRPMKCSLCQERDLDLIANWKPIPEKSLNRRRTLPGTVWGKDITPLCRCCSLPGCPHKAAGEASA